MNNKKENLLYYICVCVFHKSIWRCDDVQTKRAWMIGQIHLILFFSLFFFSTHKNWHTHTIFSLTVCHSRSLFSRSFAYFFFGFLTYSLIFLTLSLFNFRSHSLYTHNTLLLSLYLSFSVDFQTHTHTNRYLFLVFDLCVLHSFTLICYYGVDNAFSTFIEILISLCVTNEKRSPVKCHPHTYMYNTLTHKHPIETYEISSHWAYVFFLCLCVLSLYRIHYKFTFIATIQQRHCYIPFHWRMTFSNDIKRHTENKQIRIR